MIFSLFSDRSLSRGWIELHRVHIFIMNKILFEKKTAIIYFHPFLRCPTHSLLCPTNLSSSTVGATLRDLDVRWSCFFLYQNYVKAFLARAAPRTSEMVKTTKTSVSVSDLETWTWTTRSVRELRPEMLSVAFFSHLRLWLRLLGPALRWWSIID